MPKIFSLQQALVFMVVCFLLAASSDIALIVHWLLEGSASGNWLSFHGSPLWWFLTARGIAPYFFGVLSLWMIDLDR
ncbi:MAG: hypothetical protein AAF514_14505 [Verrucomicrobiota bacterium]